MSRYLLQLLYLSLLAALSACRPATVEPNWPRIGALSFDSLKYVVHTEALTQPDEMAASGALGINYFTFGQYDTARYYLNRALSMPGGREFSGGRFMANLANTYAFEGRYAEAMKHYMDAFEVSERLVATGENVAEGEANIVRVAANLAEILHTIGNDERALHYAGLAQDMLDSGRVPSVSYVLPQVLYVFGSIYLERGELDRAEEAMVRTFEVSDKAAKAMVADDPRAGGMWWYNAYACEGQAQIALARGDTDRALALATEALMYAERHGDPTVTARMEAAISDVHHARGDYVLSGEWAARALETYPEHHRLDPEVLFKAAASHLHTGESARAYQYFTGYAAQMRANSEKQFRETMAGMEIVHETEKREARIATLEKQRRLYALVGVAGGLLIITLCVTFLQKIRHERQQKRLAAQGAVIEWEKRERKRFAGDLHDGINGMLSALKLSLASGSDPQNIAPRLDECIDTIRRMARGMMPSSLERYGLKAALEDYCRLFPGVRFHFYGRERRLEEKFELTLYYCAHELVGNSVRHAGASAIDVQLIQEDTRISLTIEDNGRGFDTETVRGGCGLQNLRDRVASVGGRIDISSRSGEGTETNIEINTDTK